MINTIDSIVHRGSAKRALPFSQHEQTDQTERKQKNGQQKSEQRELLLQEADLKEQVVWLEVAEARQDSWFKLRISESHN